MNPEQNDDLQFRILALLDGTLGEEAAARLDADLRESREARVLFHQLATLHSALEEEGASRSEIRRVPLIPIDRFLAHQRRRMVGNSLLAAAAVLTISMAALWLKMAPARTVNLVEFRIAPDSAFTLTHSEKADEVPVGNSLAAGSHLRLTRGTLEGTFASGARFVIDAPCDLTVIADDRVSLVEGSAWFECPPAAVGFTVEASRFTVVDLGTKFGVIVTADQPPEVHVAKGSVELAPKFPKGAAGKLILKAGQARRLDAVGGLQEIPLQSNLFTAELPERIFIANPSFEDEENISPSGEFARGETDIDSGRGLIGWSVRGMGSRVPSVGWRDIPPHQIHPYPPARDRKSQVLSLMGGTSVHNATDRSWASLSPGDRLTLTVSLGMRSDPQLNWNEGTFFALTDGATDLARTGLTGTVANSGIIAANPATGTESGDGTFADVSFAHTVSSSDLARPGNIGILIHSEGSGGISPKNQSFFDNVRLQIDRVPAVDDPVR